MQSVAMEPFPCSVVLRETKIAIVAQHHDHSRIARPFPFNQQMLGAKVLI